MKREELNKSIKKQRVREIMAKAKIVFLKKGYFGSTMEEIAKQAGVSKGTVYHYFKNKDDLYISLMIAHFEEYADMLNNFQKRFSATSYSSAFEVIGELYQIYLSLYRHDPDALRIVQKYIIEDDFLQIDKKRKKKILSLARETRLICENILSDCIRMGLLPKINVRQMQDVFTGLFLGIAQLENQKFRLSGKDHFADTLNLCFSLISEGLLKGQERGTISLFNKSSNARIKTRKKSTAG
jgi:AcrR family transcriptional regulator